MADVRLSRVCWKINYLVYLNAVVILGCPGSSTIDCPQGRLFCFGAKAGWIDICWSVQSGAGPASASQCCVSGDESQASGKITCCLLTSVRGSGAGAGDISGPHLSWVLLLKAHSFLLATGPHFVFLCVCVCVCTPVRAYTCMSVLHYWYRTIFGQHFSIHIDSSSATGYSCFICMAQLTQAVSGHYIPIS